VNTIEPEQGWWHWFEEKDRGISYRAFTRWKKGSGLRRRTWKAFGAAVATLISEKQAQQQWEEVTRLLESHLGESVIPVWPQLAQSDPSSSTEQVGDEAGTNKRLRQPDPLAEHRVSQSGRDFLVVGAAVETLFHSTLNSSVSMRQMGWDPAKVQIVDTKQELDSGPILRRLAGGLLPLGSNEKNWTKYVLSSYSEPFKDDEENLTLSFKRTDWQTHKTVRTSPDGVEENELLALEFGNLDVERNLVPSAVGLHFIVQLADDAVLLLRRRADTPHDPNKWTLTAEEQFQTEDFQDHNLLRVFQRGLMEEIAGLYDKSPDTVSTRWKAHLSSKVEAMRLWGLIFEEHACVTSLLGFYRLGLSTQEFCKWRRSLVNRSVASIDYEGKLYWTSLDQLEELLKNGTCSAWLLATGQAVEVKASMLAKTTRYRAYRLFRSARGHLPGNHPVRFSH
jgi:hypothetical protein